MGRRIERPRIREAIPDEVIERLRADAPAGGADRTPVRALVALGALVSEHRGEGAVLGVPRAPLLRSPGRGAAVGQRPAPGHAHRPVAHYLGPSGLGRFAVLYLGANLLPQLLTIAVRPRTIRRTFAESDGGDEDEDDDEAVPTRRGEALAPSFSLRSPWPWSAAASRSGFASRSRTACSARARTEPDRWAALLERSARLQAGLDRHLVRAAPERVSRLRAEPPILALIRRGAPERATVASRTS